MAAATGKATAPPGHEDKLSYWLGGGAEESPSPLGGEWAHPVGAWPLEKGARREGVREGPRSEGTIGDEHLKGHGGQLSYGPGEDGRKGNGRTSSSVDVEMWDDLDGPRHRHLSSMAT